MTLTELNDRLRRRGASLMLALACLFLAAAGAQAGPRDEALRLAPGDAAITLVLQDARDRVHAVAGSPFVEWLPESELARSLPAGIDFRQLRGLAAPVFAALGLTPRELLDDVFGDAVVFAYTPPPPGSPGKERAILLVRPRKMETLSRIIERLNEIQMGNGEVKAVARREHGGEPFHERQKASGESEFYCIRGGVFAFSRQESDILAVIERDQKAPPVSNKAPALSARMAKLGVADSLAVVLVNPRALDAEVQAKVAAANAEEKPFLSRFAEVWAALDAAAIYLSLESGVEAGVSLDFRPQDLPAGARKWLTGVRTPSRLWTAIPDNALVAGTTRFRAGDLIATIRSMLPERARKDLDRALGETVGSVVGRERLPKVLDALGPDWAVWVEPPGDERLLPVLVGAVQIDAGGAGGQATRRTIERAVAFGFQAAQVAYNAGHTDQIETVETADGEVIITSLVNDRLFPPGVRPSYAFKGGYLVIASSPDAIRRFRSPTGSAAPGEPVAMRFSAAATRQYLKKHGSGLAKFLAASGAGDEKELQKQIDRFATILEPLDRLELVVRGSDSGIRVALRARLTKPLK